MRTFTSGKFQRGGGVRAWAGFKHEDDLRAGHRQTELQNDPPETLAGRAIRLYDADALSDDFLSSSKVEPDGPAGFLFDLSASRSLDSLFETKPDLYCVVSGDDGQILYRSNIHGYDLIDHRVLWDAVEIDIPRLIEVIDELLG